MGVGPTLAAQCFFFLLVHSFHIHANYGMRLSWSTKWNLRKLDLGARLCFFRWQYTLTHIDVVSVGCVDRKESTPVQRSKLKK